MIFEVSGVFELLLQFREQEIKRVINLFIFIRHRLVTLYEMGKDSLGYSKA